MIRRCLLVAILVLSAGACAPGPDEPRESADGSLSARLVEFEWHGFPAGFRMPGRGRLGEDCGSLSVILDVENLTDGPVPFPQGVELGRVGGQRITGFEAGLRSDADGWFEDVGEIPAGETRKVHLLSQIHDIVYLGAFGEMEVRLCDSDWVWPVGRLPEREVLLKKRIEEGCAASLSAEVKEATWVRIPSGSVVSLPDGEREITADLAGIEIEIVVTNRAKAPVSFGTPLQLLGDGDRVLCEMSPDTNRYEREEWKDLCRDIGPGESRTFAMVSKMLPYADLESISRLLLRHPFCGWRLPLPPLPSWEDIGK